MADGASGTCCVEVCRVGPGEPTLVAVRLPAGATVADAIAASGLVPGSGGGGVGGDGGESGGRLAAYGIAVLGRRVLETRRVADGERVDLLAPLMADPKVARQRRADKRRREAGDERWTRRG
jgi:putative ubiquitin-RnfH superfamily antitoxin RatB of RatAB toxin-antitoxin module